ncbi:MAG: hypothetical protein HY318_18000 [Armatimonadetes bacterium]|nr:hypothetical protein [Armatimonadota bacterium]
MPSRSDELQKTQISSLARQGQRIVAPLWPCLALLSFLLILFIADSAHSQPAPDPTIQQAGNQAIANAEKLRAAGKFDEAVGVCEEFFRQHPDCGPAGRGVVYFVDAILWRDLSPQVAKDPEAIRRVVQRGVEQFENVPDYYALCARYLVQSYLWVEPAKALTLVNQALEKLGDRIPTDYVGGSLLMFQVYSLRWNNKYAEAIVAARETAEDYPTLLSNLDFLQPVYEAAKLNGGAGKSDSRVRGDDAVGMAKLAYVLCDYTEDAISKATTFASQALTAGEGPGVGIAFAKSQEDAKVANPLKDVPIFNLGDGKKMLEVVGDDAEVKLNVLLYLGQTDPKRMQEAVAFAKDRMRAAGEAGALAGELKNLARCFKAHDLNLLRANRFLEFHRTGEGENPLKELETELAGRTKEAAPQ